MRFKQIIIIIVVIQLFSVISITGFYYMMSPLQNCLRTMIDSSDPTRDNSSIVFNNLRKRLNEKFNQKYTEFCFEKTSW